MNTPQLDERTPVASAPETLAQAPTQTPSQATSATPANHEPIVATSSRATTAEESLAEWWSKQHGFRAVVNQLIVALIVVLIVLPLASLAGWFGLRTPVASNTTTTTTTSQTSMSNSPSPNAPAHTLYNPAAPVAASGNVVNVNLVAKEARISIASGIAYDAWTFNGTVPGPIIRVRQGQTIHFTLTNSSNMSHSIDFHAAQTAWNVNYQPVAPGQSFSFDWVANYPGAFLYHCGTPPVMEHMANGMYGAIIVDPANGWATPAQEYVLVQSEFYTQRAANGDYTLNTTKMMDDMPDYVTFNGYANQYTQSPLTAKPGQQIRLFIVNAGPTHFSAFHVIGAIFSDTYVDGNPANHMVGNQTITVPPGGGMVAELTMPDAGSYPFVTHSFMDASMGAMGIIKVAP
ncbi:MAG TPA: multicopper oxidase domain-containing protein [Ktedonobacterales bacterium]